MPRTSAMSPARRSARTLRQSSSTGVRCISGGRESVMLSSHSRWLYSLKNFPGRQRPARPRRCCTLLRDASWVCSDATLVSGA